MHNKVFCVFFAIVNFSYGWISTQQSDPVILETPAIDEWYKELTSENDLKVDSSKNIEASPTDDQKPVEENNDKKDETIRNSTDISKLKRLDEYESGIEGE